MKRIIVFGKKDCVFCEILSKRLGILQKRRPELFDGFEIVKKDVTTVEGLVAFCRMLCINPNRIPAVVFEGEDGELLPNPDRKCAMDPGEGWRGNRNSCGTNYGVCRLYHILGLQTDQDRPDDGIITQEMLEGVLTIAAGM